MYSRHFDDEAEEVVDEGVEGLVRQHSPRQVRDRLELVVEVELRAHQNESEHIHATHQTANNPAIPAFVVVVYQRVDGRR